VIKDYFPQVITPALWHDAHQALASRQTQRGLITTKVSNLFTDIAHLDGERLCYRASNFIGYLNTARQDAIPLRYDHFERAVLLWLQEVKIALGDGGNDERLENHRDDLAKRVKVLESRIATDPDFESLLDTLSTLKRELAEAQRQLELAVLPTQAHVIQ